MASTKDSAVVLGRYSNICVIGAGVIGASWTALFLAHGLNVVVNDPQPDIETMVKAALSKIAPTLHALGLPHQSLDRNLRFETDLDRAVAAADLVQENGPERPEWKQQLWARIEPAVPNHALLLSSSSARPATEQGREMKDASRLLVGHPFNPPHLIPLTEIVGGAQTSEETIRRASEFYTSIGQRTVRLNKEMPGHVANRLQAALAREVITLSPMAW